MTRRLQRGAAGTLMILGILGGARVAAAAVINVVPTDSDVDNYTKIEAAGPGDEVVIAPGTYRFRVYLEGAGTASQPIVIRAADPNDRPVWDLDGDTTGNWPGSYTGGDAYRAIWQVTGSHYHISGIVFANGTDGGTGDSGGLRMKSSDHLTLYDCLFQRNDNGLQGSGTNTLVEFCEFDENGLPGSTDGAHNFYIHGGDLVVRFCHIHDARRSQNLHIRANHAVFEYNWIARSASYMGDMMPCTFDPCDADQYLVLRGNVIERGTPANDGQVFVMYNDQGTSGKRFHLTLISNTILGNGDAAALVHFANDDPALNELQEAVLDNNVILDVSRVFRTDSPGLSNWSAEGTNNWISQGTADTAGLSSTVTGTDPGFADPGAGDYAPGAGSLLIGAADTSVTGLPDREYYPHLRYRWRSSAADIGAFESTTTGSPIGPHDDVPGPDGGVGADATPGADAGPATDGGTAGPDGGGDPTGDSGGCGCTAGGSARGKAGGFGLLLLVFAGLWLRRRLRLKRISKRPTRWTSA